jgi:polysaccharide biosynthesis transport protein
MMSRSSTQSSSPQFNGSPAGASFASESATDGLPQTLWRHRWLLAASLFFVLACSLVYLARATPMYASSSRLYFEQSPSQLLGNGQSVISDAYLHAQCELFKSTPILTDAAALLANQPLKTLAGKSNVVDVLRGGLDVSVGKDDQIVNVIFESPYPKECALIVNSVVQAYVNFESQHRRSTANEALTILQHAKEKRDAEISKGMKDLLDFKKANGAVSFDTDKGNVITQKLTRISDELTTAQLQTMDLKARYDALADALGPQLARDQMIADPAGTKMTVAAAEGSQETDPAWMRAEISRAELNLESLSARYPSSNPSVVDATAYLDRLHQRMAELEGQQGTAALAMARDSLQIAQRRESELQKAFNAQQAIASDLNSKLAEYSRLEDQLQRAERESDALDNQIKSINVTEDAPQEVRILDVAQPNMTPQSPKKMQIAAMASVLGLLAGIGMALAMDVIDQRLRSPEEVRNLLGLPVLGVIPRQDGKLSVAACGLTVHSDPMSQVAEACRTVRTAVYFASRTAPVKTVLIASPSHEEGKSSFVSNLAIAMAQAGSRVLLLDANFREPAQQKIYDVEHDTGLSEVLSGKIALDRAISRTPIEGLEVLPCGPLPRNPSEMLNGPAFAKLIETLSDRYEFILMDSPSILSVTDARILGAIADVTLFVIRAGVTSRKAGEQGLDSLLSVGSRVLGAVVNDMPGRRPMPRPRGTLRIFDPMLAIASNGIALQGGSNGNGHGPALMLGSKKELTTMQKVESVD